MTEHPSNHRPLSPLERLANVCDALCDDELFVAQAETEKERSERAKTVVRAAMNEALGIAPPPPSRADMPSKDNLGWLQRRFSTPGRFAQIFGLHPAIAILLTALNVALSAAAWGTLGADLLLEIPVAPVVGFITFATQKKWYGDDGTSALIKGLIAMFLTMLPIPLAPFIFVPAGIVGLLRRKAFETRKTTETHDKKEDSVKR